MNLDDIEDKIHAWVEIAILISYGLLLPMLLLVLIIALIFKVIL